MSKGTMDRVDVAKTMLSKVPEVTVYFWIIKILCTTVGETPQTSSTSTSTWA